MEKACAWCCCLMAMAILASVCHAQDTSCLSQLVPCLSYLNSTSGSPKSDCCDPLRSVIKSDPQCLCSLISSNTATSGINVTQALLLPSKCGANVSAATCTAASSPSNRGTESNSGNRFSFAKILLAAALPSMIQAFVGMV